MKDYLSIKEFSEFTQIEQSTLRYWDDIGLFPPAMRDPNNNYRYYSPQQIVGVNFVSILSELDISLKTINEIRRERTPEKVMNLIAEHERLLDMKLHKLREKYSIMHARQKLIADGIEARQMLDCVAQGQDEPDDRHPRSLSIKSALIEVVHKKEMTYLKGPRNHFTRDGDFYASFMNYFAQAKEHHINLGFPVGGLHERVDSFESMPGSPDYFFSYDPTGNRRSSAGLYLVGITKGFYGQLGELPQRMLEYATEHELELKGPVFTICLLDEMCMTDPSQLLSRVSIALDA